MLVLTLLLCGFAGRKPWVSPENEQNFPTQLATLTRLAKSQTRKEVSSYMGTLALQVVPSEGCAATMCNAVACVLVLVASHC